jgi:methylated-DNA-[protein]-cysteine S-methyltransferase
VEKFGLTTESPVGPLHLFASEEGLTGCYCNTHRDDLPKAESDAHPLLTQAAGQLAEYFAGQRTNFDLPLAPTGTPFQRAVWERLRSIPYGMTMTYGELAAQMGDAKLSRAVGAANGANPVGIIVPCHRVIAANGHLTGYAGGIEVKRFLLDLENPLFAG